MHEILVAAVLLLEPVMAQTPERTLPTPPALTVVLCVDQLAAWVLQDSLPVLRRGGLRRLIDEGVWFTNCRFDHALTTTGPGHATIGTGAPPRVHGIVDNSWFDRDTGASVGCVQDAKDGLSARHLLVPTLGDVLEASTKGRSVVVGMSIKDRSAILMAGHDADVALWYDVQRGTFGSSPYFGTTPAWADRFNGRRVADRYFGRAWIRMGTAKDYAGLVDDRPYEQTDPAGRRTLPRLIDGGLAAPGPAFYEQLCCSPFSNDLLLELVDAAMHGQHLGEDEVPDLLCLGFSANDWVGHAYGPLSVEVRDMCMRLDAQIASLLRHLDAHLGPDRYAFFLTADHGVCAAPEASGRGRRDIRVPLIAASRGEQALRKAFGVPAAGGRWIRSVMSSQVYLNRKACAAAGVEVEVVARRLVEVLAQVKGIGRAVCTAAAIEADDEIGRSIRASVHPDRCGDVFVVPASGWLFTRDAATHGSPHDYDRHVPLFVKAPGIRRGHKETRNVSPGVIAVLGAWLCGVTAPKSATAGLPLDQLLLSVRQAPR